tara:strand:+ start:666 stop:893 length:228 start_codon:yes stop_codon:yes gene_type:complete
MQKLYTKHYQTKILNTKKFTLKTLSGNIQKYIGFKINDLLNLKFYQKNPNIIDFTHKGYTYINIKNIPESTLQSI